MDAASRPVEPGAQRHRAPPTKASSGADERRPPNEGTTPVISFARVTAALALAGAIISTPAYAAPAGEAISMRVSTAGLDLSSAAGQARLTRRVGHAATMVCGHPDERDLDGTRASKICRTRAIDDAMPQVQLALSAGKAGRQLAANSIAVMARAF